MAYFTDFSYRQLMERVDIEKKDRIDVQFFKENIFENGKLFYFFNQLELRKLYIEKLLLSGDENTAFVLREVPEREDNFNYILSIRGNVKYHNNNECPALFKGFKNFFMPEAVVRLAETDKEKHKELVEEIRKWFIQNNYTVERYEKGEISDLTLTQNFNSTFPQKYNIDKIIISQSDKSQYNWYIERKSKGPVYAEEKFNFEKFVVKIDDLIIRREMRCNSPTMQNLSKYDFLVNKENYEIEARIIESIEKEFLKMVDPIFLKNYGIGNLKKFWKNHIDLKRIGLQYLFEYFKWTFNYNNQTFDEIFLEDFKTM